MLVSHLNFEKVFYVGSKAGDSANFGPNQINQRYKESVKPVPLNTQA